MPAESPTLNQAEMLDRATDHNPHVFNLDESARIRSLYPCPTGKIISMDLLATELKENLGDEKGKRTPNFEKLVELGLLSGKETYSYMDSTLPKEGNTLLTHKGAAFLGIDLGIFSVCGEILTIQENYRNEVAALTKTADSQIGLLLFFSGIIDTEPKLQEACPTGSLVIFLREAMLFMSVHINTSTKAIPESILSGMRTLGWIEDHALDENKTTSELLTEKGRNRLTAYKHLWKQKEGL